jgi:capsular exopolysaccharide synthesis family protein
MNREVAQDQVLRDVFRLLRRQRWVIIATTLLALAAAVAYSVIKEKEYEATAQIQFVDQSQYLSTIGTPVPFTGLDPAKLAAQEAERVTSAQVVSAVSKDVKSDLSSSEIKDSVTTSVNPDNNLVALSVTAKSGKLAADLANAFALQTKKIITASQRARFLSQAKSLEDSVKHLDDTSIQKQTAEQDAARLRSVARVANPVEIASPASVPGSPSSPKPVRDTILALFLGLIFGTLLAFLRDSLDRRLTDPHEIQHQLQIPMLGYVDDASLGASGFAQNGEGDRGLEPFRILRANVDFLAGEAAVKTLAVTSPLAEEGKSTVAAGLATATALADKRVLLVECDLRRPVFAERFDIPATPGLTDWAAGNAKPAEVIRSVQVGRTNGSKPAEESNGSSHLLTVISAGSFSSEPAELLASRRFRDFVQEVKEVYDLVVFDCAPLLPVGDALEVLPVADAALLCIRLDQTTREQALAAKAAIDHLPERPLGLVLTGVRPGREGYYYGYYSSTPRQPAIVLQPPGQS